MEAERSWHGQGAGGAMPKGSTPKAHVTYIAQCEKKPEFTRSESMEAEDPHCCFDNPQIAPSLVPILLQLWLNVEEDEIKFNLRSLPGGK